MAEWLPLAEGGDAVSQNSVGALYDHGLGVDEDDTEAARWYQMAADQGLPLAMRNLAGMYAGGHGLPYDKDQAIYWYEKAAEAGDEKSAQRLAALDPARAAAIAPAPVQSATVEPAPGDATPAAPMTVAGGDDASAMTDGGAAADVPQTATAEVAQTATAEAAPAEPAPAAPASTDGSSGDLQYGEGTASVTAAAPAEPAATQQASLVTPAPVAGNWLIGQWQGPSLGCPPGGGLEFAPTETRSYFGGKVAAKLAATYQAAGDLITVVTTGVDGIGHSYQYRRSADDRFVIAAVPPEMPANMVGVEYRRCGAAPLQSAAAPAAPAAPAEQPQAAAPSGAKPFVPSADATEPAIPPLEPPSSPPTTSATVPTAPTIAVPQVAKLPTAPGAGGASAQAGWDAFGRGDYQGALAVWTPLAEAGDVDMQMLVGSIYDYGQGVPQDDGEAAKWYQMAAERGSAKAQYQLGALYTRSPQVKDPVKGYEWLTIAAKTIGDGNVSGITADQATTLRALAAMGMTKEDVTAAEAAAAAFKAKQ